MSLAALLNETVTLATVTLATVTSGARDSYGRPGTSTTTQTVNGRLDQRQTVETVGDRDVTTTRFVLYLEPGVTVHPQDRVTVGGVTYQVDGEPWQAQGARAVHHLEVPLRLVEA